MSGAGRVPRHVQRGVSLVELMVALVLGLIVSGAAISLVVANKQTYLAAESLGHLQENGSTAFELMARDIREAGGNPCDHTVDLVNVLNAPASNWYTDFATSVRGYDGATAMQGLAFGTSKGDRVAGTDAIELKSAVADGVSIVKHTPPSAQFQLSTKDHGFQSGDLALACDFNHAAVLQVTNAQPGVNANLVHNNGNVVTPGNCTKGLGSPLNCATATGTAYEFGCKFGGQDPGIDCTLPANRWTAVLARVRATRWYVGYNGRGGKSLFQSQVRNNGGVLVVDRNEIADDIDTMTLTYLSGGGAAYQAAGAVGNWSQVVAVRIQLALAGQSKVGTDGAVLQRSLGHVVAIRNRAK